MHGLLFSEMTLLTRPNPCMGILMTDPSDGDDGNCKQQGLASPPTPSHLCLITKKRQNVW